ncbi:acyltransferase family protein [Ornithinimicrobium ciconiae]|uniref:acyltransferase family protein n=1 Tax=Ornithinimicrobium ciconiae TaxID=2594265 RepID=UPI0013FD0414|nr:acyltransferase family protein [Ornithinimicrobium ciconiae]
MAQTPSPTTGALPQPVAGSRSGLRRDLQALRALAVALVVLWHAEIPGLSGGFIGVDVFFVISGFLMVRLLVGELDRSGGIRVGRFLHRRARRLLPAALLVLAVTALGSWWLLPVTALRSVGWDIVASVAYVANWRFAATEVDYLAAEALPSPVQHYWSLSIEEQFYFVLPLALLLVALLTRRWARGPGRAMRVGTVTLLAIGVPSLLYSVVHSSSPDPGDYFNSLGRVWQLCVGGAVALLALRGSARSVPGGLRSAAVLVGMVGIVASAVLITPESIYPGWLALMPTVATALIVWADGDDLAVSRPGAAPWVQWLGDRSYSIYLWHWPLLLLVMVQFDGSVLARAGAVLASLVLADVSWRLVEERFRLRGSISAPARAPGLSRSAGLMVTPAARRSVLVLAVASTLTAAGGLAITTDRDAGDLTPSLADATADKFTEFYEGDCRPKVSSPDPLTCTFGVPSSATRVLVVGDSHAVMWMPGLRAVAEENGWRLDLQAKLACAPVDATNMLDSQPYTACRDWGRNVVQGIVDDPPDLVILATSTGYSIVSPEAEAGGGLQDALGRTLEQIRAAGPEVALMAVTPRFAEPVPICLAEHPDDPQACQAHLPSAIPDNQWAEVAASVPGVHTVDLADELCPDGTCLTDADGILRWMDSHHLTGTYAESLAPLLAKQLLPLVAAR